MEPTPASSGSSGSEEDHQPQTKTNKKANVRHAEKTRKFSTCAFADRVCDCVVDAWRRDSSLLAERAKAKQANTEAGEHHTGQQNQTVLAGFVAFDRTRNEMQCLSWATGTKFLTYAHEELREEVCLQRSFVVDMHAEVLAKKALVLSLQKQCDAATANANTSSYNSSQRLLQKLISSSERASISTSSTSSLVSPYVSNPEAPSRQRNTPDVVDEEASHLPIEQEVSLHMYVSSAPCGDACVRKWAKGGLGPVFPEMPDSKWPVLGKDIHRPPFHYFAKKEGQGRFLQKGSVVVVPGSREQNKGSAASSSADGHGRDTRNKPSSSTRGEDLHVGLAVQPWQPRAQRTPLSCSDKILKWQACGFQGSYLSTNSLSPLRLSTLTVGRKFTDAHMSRAVWERYTDLYSQKKSTNTKKDAKKTKKIEVNKTPSSSAADANRKPSESEGKTLGEVDAIMETPSRKRVGSSPVDGHVESPKRTRPVRLPSLEAKVGQVEHDHFNGTKASLSSYSRPVAQAEGSSASSSNSRAYEKVGKEKVKHKEEVEDHREDTSDEKFKMPTCMVTSRKLDDAVYEDGEGSNFSDPRCEWWCEGLETPEIIDGRTGRPMDMSTTTVPEVGADRDRSTGSRSHDPLASGSVPYSRTTAASRLLTLRKCTPKSEDCAAEELSEYADAKSRVYLYFAGLQGGRWKLIDPEDLIEYADAKARGYLSFAPGLVGERLYKLVRQKM
ncbi:unnamed protein product [Amoebophrya sp. A25]|nr:unnamed protein product [Amoebophrya sp. A25]|eukprot:GSA25T00019353001.1